MTDLDKMARELLAGELARDGWAGELAAVLLADRPDDARVPGNMALATIRAALLTAPAGWKLVPVEPTQEMLDEVCSSDGIEPWTDDVMASTYRAMIAAAPEVT